MPCVVAQTMISQLNAAREHVDLVGALTDVAEDAIPIVCNKVLH